MEAQAEAEAKSLRGYLLHDLLLILERSKYLTRHIILGDAKAFAIATKAKAEAEQMVKKAEAWRDYKEAAMVDMMLQVRVPNANLGSNLSSCLIYIGDAKNSLRSCSSSHSHQKNHNDCGWKWRDWCL